MGKIATVFTKCRYFSLLFRNWSQGIYVVVGTNDLTMGGSHISVQSIKIHEQYDNATSKNNIALIRTASNILSVPQTSTVALGIASTLPGQMCTLTGWGKEYLAMPLYSNILRYAQFSVLSLDECRWYLYGIHNSEICTNPSTSGGCDGDNGGPLVTVADNVQIGILSRGVPCAMGKPDVYTNVAHYSNWIDQHSGSMISALSPFFLALLLSSCCLM
ncbi:hypothetical protein RI129_012433 [Pyrocoelia pectoralis]|uniref:Peptidase S1 domain-containing protein n=1 Tax=Pyrocoelia pectoralis TaxID=417401 RepID=A0AAN7ZFX0_9COLE